MEGKPVAPATRAELAALTVKALADRAKKAGLRVGGTKAELVERLLLAQPPGGGGGGGSGGEGRGRRG